MSEMVEMKSGAIADQSTIFTAFHISEYIYIRLVCISFLFVPFQESNDLRSYNDLNRSKLLLSTAILAMRTQECPIPIFVEVVNLFFFFHSREFPRVRLFSGATSLTTESVAAARRFPHRSIGAAPISVRTFPP